MKYHTFKVNIPEYPNVSEPPVVTFDVDGDSNREEIIEAFEGFLKAIGYSWKEGDYLDFVPEEEEACPSEEDTNRGIWTPHKSTQRLVTHLPEKCKGQNCAVHNVSDHHMKDWPQHYRADVGITERICPHGVGHPDPDDPASRDLIKGVHGCDGCCDTDKISNPTKIPTNLL